MHVSVLARARWWAVAAPRLRCGPPGSARLQALVLAVVVAGATLVAAPAAPSGADLPALPPLRSADSHGITTARWALANPFAGPAQGRVADATVTTDLVFEPVGSAPDRSHDVNVRVYLPEGYDADRATPYPVLYLLHGGGGDHRSWSRWNEGDIVDLLATVMDADPTDGTPGTAFDGIVVMPGEGLTGWYSDWHGGTVGGFRPLWESFTVDQLVPWVDANFNTEAGRDGRAVAGLSMGGAGALMYAGRHGDLFSAVGSFSGGTDLTLDWAQHLIARTLAKVDTDGDGDIDLFDTGLAPGAALTYLDALNPAYKVDTGLDTRQRMELVFGPSDATGDWPATNPARMVEEYRSYDGRFGLYSGTGLPGGTDGEPYIGQANDDFDALLDAAGVDHRYCRGPGDHSWGYWRADLADFLNYAYGTPWQDCTLNDGWHAG